MRVFWSLMLVLFVASMGVFVRPRTAERVPTRGEQARIVREPAMPQTPAIPSLVPGVSEPGGVVAAHDETIVETPGELEADEPTDATDYDADTAPNDSASSVSDASVPEIEAPAEVPVLDPFAAAAEAYLQRSRAETAKPEPDHKSIAETPAANETTEAATSETEANAKTPASKAAEHTAIVRADGSLRIGQTVVIGDGTAARPYEINWPLLTGVARVYKPEKGLNKLPEWLALLEGKRVRLTGHIVLPLVATSTDELLLTMNPWDGCCVGVPPTPYDAMEVTMSEPVSMQGASMYGSLEGNFRTDPYIAGGWLLGLYLLDDARVVE